MLRSSPSAVLALLALSNSLVAAQSSDSIRIWSSAVFARSGEHTTIVNKLASQLTALGANQASQVGVYLRDRYLLKTPIQGLDTSLISEDDIYILASDDSQFGPASATAILQGLYPPMNGGELNPLGVMAREPYLQNPLNGYQYPWIHTAGSNDPDSIYVNGAEYCTRWNSYLLEYNVAAFSSPAEVQSKAFYQEVGRQIGDPDLQASEYGYFNAYLAYEQASYLYNHNVNLTSAINSVITQFDALNRLRILADGFLWNLYGNPDTVDESHPIKWIAGKTLASKVLAVLGNNIFSYGQQNKLNILVGDFAPLISFFGLAGLQQASSDFTGMPGWGSIAAFELYSPADAPLYHDSTLGVEYPFLPDLHVRFVFRNGTTGPDSIHPLFGSDQLSMTWNDFETAMRAISFGPNAIGEWCKTCDSWLTSPFCLSNNQRALNAFNGLGSPITGLLPVPESSLSPVTAGIIGAGVTIGVLGLLVLLAMLLCGLRFGIAKREPNGAWGGGFKGNQKMASDADLTASNGARGEIPDGRDTKERVGSWELKQKAATANPNGANLQPAAGTQSARPLSFVSSIRRSFDMHDPVHNPFQDPVKPDERV